jgi:hypothetical protein
MGLFASLNYFLKWVFLQCRKKEMDDDISVQSDKSALKEEFFFAGEISIFSILYSTLFHLRHFRFLCVGEY